MYPRNWPRRNLIGILTFQKMTCIWPKNLIDHLFTIGRGGLDARLTIHITQPRIFVIVSGLIA